jgi:alkylation response protein AidB-like acyl-CoA dehydrogenase
MISFAPTEDEATLVQVTHEFAHERVRPALRLGEESRGVPAELERSFWRLGVGLAHYPPARGGGGLSLRAAVMVEEELAWGDVALAAALPRPGLAGDVLGALDTPNALAELSRLLGDEPARGALLFAHLGGRDVAHANQPGTGEITLHGKSPGVPAADHAQCVVVATTLGATPAIVTLPEHGAGWTFHPEDDVLGLRAMRLGTVVFERCCVPQERTLGRGEIATAALRRGLVVALLRWAAWAVGVGRAAFEYAAGYAVQRRTFGRPIAEHQAVAFLIADMGIGVDAARSLVWEAAWAADTGHANHLALVAAAAHYGADQAVRTTTDAVQILGGHGYVQDHPVEKWMRDARTLANVLQTGIRHLESLP